MLHIIIYINSLLRNFQSLEVTTIPISYEEWFVAATNLGPSVLLVGKLVPGNKGPMPVFLDYLITGRHQLSPRVSAGQFLSHQNTGILKEQCEFLLQLSMNFNKGIPYLMN